MTANDARLAIDGGSPVRTKPWLENVTTGDEEKQAVHEVLETGNLSLFEGAHQPDPPFSFWGGPYVQKLEREWAARYGARHGVAMNSATSGLYAAIGALGLGYGDEIIVSPYTMSACGIGALVYGAIPVFADVELATGCLDPASVEARITDRTRAVLVVHQFGTPADMDGIMALARDHGLRVIEDCAQAHGAMYKGTPVGTIGDVGVFSLNVNKSIQTGEGGVCITSSDDLRYRLALIRNHGEAVVEDARYEDIVNIVGFNLRMTEIQAAIASVQLAKLDDLTATRLQYVAMLDEAFAAHSELSPVGLAASRFEPGDGSVATYYQYPFRYVPGPTAPSRSDFVRAVNAEGLRLGAGYVRPLYLQPIYQRRTAFKHGYPFTAPENLGGSANYEAGACPTAERLYYRELVHCEDARPPHTPDDIADIVGAVGKVLAAYRR